MLPHWLRSVRRYLGLWTTATRPACRRAPHRRSLRSSLERLECLEDRIVPSGLTLNPPTLPADTINVAYANQTISATGGTGNVTLTVNVTNAIPGLSIAGNNTSSLSISGTPTAAGTETFTVTGTDDASDSTGPVSYSITVNPALTLSSTTQALIVTSYVTNAVYEVDANTGALLATLVAPNSQSILMGPAGVTVGPDGNLYITGEGYNGSSFTGPYNIVEYNFSTQTLSTFISGAQMQAANGGVPFAPGGIAFGPDGNLYTDNTLPGDGADQVIRFGITNQGGQLAYSGTNLTLATGLSVACDITFGVNPGDEGNLYVSDDNSVLKITGATTNAPSSSLFVSAGSGGLVYSCGLTWMGGNLYDTDPGSGQVLEYSDTGSFLGDFTGSALQNPNQQPINTLFLPNGDVVTSNFGPGSGFLVGTQGNEAGSLTLFNSSGQFLQNLGAGAFPANAAGVTNAALAFMTFDTTAPATESTVVLAQDTINAPYNQSLTPNGGTGAVTLSVSNVQNTIPGLNITGNGTSSLSIAGTPTATGTETFTVTATDSLGGTTTTSYTLTVNSAPTLSTSTLPADTTNVAYNQSISATGGTGSIALAVNVTNAIPGLSITGSGTSSISISGTPTAAGTETFTVTGTDGAGGTTGAQQYSITVSPAITLSSTTQALIVTSYVTNAVYEVDANTGALLATLVAPNSQSILMGPAGVTVGPDGNLYITGEGYNGSSFTGPYNIVEYNFSTQTLSTFISGAQMQAANGGVPFAPGGIAFGLDGNLYTDNTLPGDGADQVIRFGITNQGGQLAYSGTNLTLATGLSVACDITFGANAGDEGNLYVSDDNSVLKITDATTNAPSSSLFVSAGSGGLVYSCGLTWMGGNLYDTDPGSGQVLEYSATGSFLGDFTGSALQNPNQQPCNGLFLPDGDFVTANFGPGSGFLVGTQGNEAGSLTFFNSSGQFLQNLGAGAFPANAAGVTNAALAFMTFDTTAPATESTVVLAQDTINAPYNQSITPNGGTGAVTLNVSNVQNTIPGLNITGNGTSSIAISGTPTATGTETFTVTATDSVGGTTTTNYTVTVNPAATLSPATLPGDTTNVAYANRTITASGGTGTVTLVVNVTNAIPGLSITGSGTSSISISGTPTAAGTETFTVTGTDGVGGTTGPRQYTVVVVASAPLKVSPIALRTATVGDNFSEQLTAMGGSGKGYSFTASGLPDGLTLSSTGLLSGIPAAPTVAPLNFAVTLTDSHDVSRTFGYTLNVDPAIALTSTLLPLATVGNAFSTHLLATGGSGRGFVFHATGLPAWLHVSSTGLVSGTPPATAGASASFLVTVTDSAKGTNSFSCTLSVDPALVLSPTTLTVVTVGNVFSTQLTAAGGSGTGYTFTGNNLPSWMSLSSDGLLTGAPTSALGSPRHFTVTATDGVGGRVSHTYSLRVNSALAVKPVPLPAATVGDAYSVQLGATGGSGRGYFFTAPALPAWLTLSSSGLLSGMPPAATGTPLDFTVTVTDSNSATGNHAYSLTVDPALTLSSGPLPTATVGDAYRQQLTATGGSGSGYRFTLGSHPGWLTLSSTGLLGGTPPVTAGASVAVAVTVSDSQKGTTTANYSLNINPALVLSPTTLTVVTVGQQFSTPLTAAGGSGSGYIFTMGSHPAWLNLSPSGLLSGTPTTATGSPFHFTVTATDSQGGTGSHRYALSVDPALKIKPVTLPVATVGDLFSQHLTPTGGSGRGYVFTAPTLPFWLTLSPSGRLTGTPPNLVLSPVTFAVTLTDSNGVITSQSYSLTVDPAIAVAPSFLPPATVGQPMSVQLTATGGSGTGYSFTAVGLPPGLHLSRAGLLHGTPTVAAAAPFHVTVTVTDSIGGKTSSPYSVIVVT